ncbi:MAG: M56 family metallopeptidase, partial [Acidobacteriota bacterium]
SNLPPVVAEVQDWIGVGANVFLSHEIDSPVTFGIREATVILPAAFANMNEARQRAVLCHELLHVRRRDWAFIILEEFVRSLFWFHPAIWWVLGRIHLTREQVIDLEVVSMTGSRDPYLESLLEIARARGRPRAVPAPLFLRERHLVERVALLLTEVSMSKTRLVVSLAGAVGLLACSGYLAAGWFPFSGPPELSQGSQADAQQRQAVRREPIRVGSNVQQTKLIHRVDPVYPEKARQARVAGQVILQVSINEEGLVSEAKVMKGHPLLNDATVLAVQRWRYSPTFLNGEAVPVIATVSVSFDPDAGPSYAMVVLSMDETGTLTETATGLAGHDLRTKIAKTSDHIVVSISRTTPLAVAEGAVRYLLSMGVRNVTIGGRFSLYGDRLFHNPPVGGVTAPQLALDQDRLSSLVDFGRLPPPRPVVRAVPPGVTPTPPPPSPGAALRYSVFVNEVGEIVGVKGARNMEMPALEAELIRAKVVAPGLLEGRPVPAVAVVFVTVTRPEW